MLKENPKIREIECEKENKNYLLVGGRMDTKRKTEHSEIYFER